MTNETSTDFLTEYFEPSSYRYLEKMLDRWRNRLYFSDGGKMRLAHIGGYILGIHNSGNTDFARKLADSFITTMDRLAGENTVIAISNKNTSFLSAEFVNVTVPKSKCILYDDGTLHGFGVNWLHPIDPNDYYAKLAELNSQLENDEHRYEKSKQNAQKLNEEYKVISFISGLERQTDLITERRWPAQSFDCLEVFYRHFYNGGLLYHGPDGGEVFAVTLDKCLWSIHT